MEHHNNFMDEVRLPQLTVCVQVGVLTVLNVSLQKLVVAALSMSHVVIVNIPMQVSHQHPAVSRGARLSTFWRAGFTAG